MLLKYSCSVIVPSMVGESKSEGFQSFRSAFRKFERGMLMLSEGQLQCLHNIDWVIFRDPYRPQSLSCISVSPMTNAIANLIRTRHNLLFHGKLVHSKPSVPLHASRNVASAPSREACRFLMLSVEESPLRWGW